ncbi:MAG: hypothetical protein AAGA06_02175 [Pseudomonadota bacterium]
MADNNDAADPRGLIRESYRIDGITLEECRSIFLDWAISVPVGEESTAHVTVLLDTYAGDAPDHPMTQVLREALAPAARTGRRGGARGRRG